MHPDPQDHFTREQREREAADMATWGCNTARNLVSKSTMSTANPEQPAPTPRTPAIFTPASMPMGDWMHAEHYEELKHWAYKRISQLERELNAAKQPVPDAGVREPHDEALIQAWRCGIETVRDTAIAMRDAQRHAPNVLLAEAPEKLRKLACALLDLEAAPTPATSEDTLMLEYVIALLKDGEEPSRVICGPNGEPLNRWFGLSSLKDMDIRQALRAAMAHAGAQKT